MNAASSLRSVPAQWTLLAANAPNDAIDDACVVWSEPEQIALGPLLSGLTPNRDHNAELSQALVSQPPNDGTRAPIFAVFAADPFLNANRLAAALLAKRYERIVNWPTTAQYGGTFVRTLDSVNLGPRQECETLRRFSGLGLKVSAAITSHEHAEMFVELEPELLFVCAGFDLCKRNGQLDAGRLLRSCAAIANAVKDEVPLILMSPRGSVTLEQARSAGAHGLLVA